MHVVAALARNAVPTADSANGQSFMPHSYGNGLSEDQIDQLVAYLASLR